LALKMRFNHFHKYFLLFFNLIKMNYDGRLLYILKKNKNYNTSSLVEKTLN
jgi:hypothetical protein